MKKIKILLTLLLATSSLFANPFNDKLSQEEKVKLENGEILIRNIDYTKNMVFSEGVSKKGDFLLNTVKDVKPKYLAEVIQVKPYKGNENYAEVLNQLLYIMSSLAILI